MTSRYTVLLLALTLTSCTPEKPAHGIKIEYHEVYELANIILALTPHGLEDPWQVQKDFPYYDAMRAHFEPAMDHPLLDSVNFQREQWMEFLSFRTDAYAFGFDDQGKLQRTSDFYSFEITEFDDHLELVQDFAEKSGFRSFFAAQSAYRESIIAQYENWYMLDEMKAFLTAEFGDTFAGRQYSVVVSPFVGSQNLHRDIDSTHTADFPTLSRELIEGRVGEDKKERATEIHTLFTEMDHGYINPVIDEHKDEIMMLFDESVWSDSSGYEEYDTAVFAEYMTWAVYDLFVQEHFPEYAEELSLYWHFQNDSRGFQYSHMFTQELIKLHNEAGADVKLRDLLLPMARKASQIAPTISKSVIAKKGIQKLKDNHYQVNFTFSEEMQPAKSFSLLIWSESGGREIVEIDASHALEWSNNNQALQFELPLDVPAGKTYLIMNWWGTPKPLKAANGTLLKALSEIEVR